MTEMGTGRDANFVVTEATGHGDFLSRTQEKLPYSGIKFKRTKDPSF